MRAAAPAATTLPGPAAPAWPALADGALRAAVVALAVASLAGLPVVAGRVPDGWARLALVGWTGVISVLLGALLTVVARGRRIALRAPAWLAGAAPLACAAAIVGAVALVHLRVFGGMPQFPDSFAELVQARILAAGRLWLPAPADPAAFAIANIVDDAGRWYAQYPVGNPALLALGILTGASWLPPVLIAASLAAGTWALGVEAVGRDGAVVALALSLASPMLVLSAAAGMSQATTAALAVWVLFAALRARRSASPPAALGAGVLVGLAAAVRPMDAAVLGVVVAAYLAAGPATRRPAPPGALALGALLGAAPLLLANAATTGAPLRFGYTVLWGRGTLPGFGVRGIGVPFGPLDAVRNTLFDLGGLDLALLEWPAPVLLVVAGAVVTRRALPSAQRLLLGYVLAQVAAYFTYYHHDFFYGPRFLLPAAPALLLVLADGLVRAARWRPAAGRVPRALALGRTLLVAQAVCAFALLAAPRLLRAGSRDVAAAAAVARAAAGLPPAIVLVDDGWGARLVGRLWRLGVGVPAAERLYAGADACSLELALGAVERRGLSGDAARAELRRLLADAGPGVPTGAPPAPSLRLAPGAPLPPPCGAQLAYDREWLRASLAPLLWLNRPDGRGVLFRRDPGPAERVRSAGRPVFRARIVPAPAGFDVRFEPLPGGITPHVASE
ncbi:MAG: hypothetical protein IRZ00_02640 [Gemmatimonadetes bacterium]|nr:hypothetical protein [Gemmatimonadota bacterium]